MKIISLLYFTFMTALILFPIKIKAGTCTSISRTNAAANSVLTSTKYNSDLNTVYTQVNDLDGGCITDGTLEVGALNTTDFAVPFKALKSGCTVTRSDAATLAVSECLISAGNEFVSTTTQSTVTWGCTGCASETTDTQYYLYAGSGASGSDLDLLISTTAPNGDGYDGSGNRILGSFYNNGSGDIAQSVSTFETTNFLPVSNSFERSKRVAVESCYVDNEDSNPNSQSAHELCDGWIESYTRIGTGDTTVSFYEDVFVAQPACSCTIENGGAGATGDRVCGIDTNDSNGSVRALTATVGGTQVDADFTLVCVGVRP